MKDQANGLTFRRIMHFGKYRGPLDDVDIFFATIDPNVGSIEELKRAIKQNNTCFGVQNVGKPKIEDLPKLAKRIGIDHSPTQTTYSYIFWEDGILGEQEVFMVEITNTNPKVVCDSASLSYRGRRHQIPAHSLGPSNWGQKSVGFDRRLERKRVNLGLDVGLTDEEYYFDCFQD